MQHCEVGSACHDTGAGPIEFMLLRTGFGLLLGKQVLHIAVRSLMQVKQYFGLSMSNLMFQTAAIFRALMEQVGLLYDGGEKGRTLPSLANLLSLQRCSRMGGIFWSRTHVASLNTATSFFSQSFKRQCDRHRQSLKLRYFL